MSRSIFLVFALALAGVGAAAEGVTSGDGAWTARLGADGRVLIITDAETGAVAHRCAVESRDHADTRVAALISLPERRSFLLALADAPELWEIALFADAGPFHDGFVHSYESGMEEGLSSEEGLFARRRIMIEAPVAALAPVPGKRHAVIGTRADGSRVEINLAVKREIRILPPG